MGVTDDEVFHASIGSDFVTHLSAQEEYPNAPPRLFMGINSVTFEDVPAEYLPSHPVDGADGAEYISAILNHVAHQICKEDPLADAWNTAAGKGGKFGASPEEEDWARQVAKMTLFLGYDAPDDTAKFPNLPARNKLAYSALTYTYQRIQARYLKQSAWDQYIGDKVTKNILSPDADDMGRHDDPAYSLTTACQMFTTMVLQTRGFTLEADMAGCGTTAGYNDALPIFARTGGWYGLPRKITTKVGDKDVVAESQSTNTDRDSSAKHAIALQVTPGSVCCFDPNQGLAGTGQATGSHIWSVLRLEHGEGAKHFQNLDGAGTQDLLPKPPATKNDNPFLGRTDRLERYESDWLEGASVPGGWCGTGVAPVVPPDQLAHATAWIKRARPVGVARLVITKRDSPSKGDPTVVYASPFARTWGNGETDNYPPSVFIYSLRHTPYYKSLQCFWFIYAPNDVLATEMWKDGARDTPLASFAGGDDRKALRLVLIVTHDADGLVSVPWRMKTTDPMAVPLGTSLKRFTDEYSGNTMTSPTRQWDDEYVLPSILAAEAVVDVPDLFEGI